MSRLGGRYGGHARRGAFDLARRLNRDLRNIPRMPELLGFILTRTEKVALGLA